MPKHIEIAVNWWADKLKGCKHSGLSEEERRDPANNSYQLAEMLMTLSKPKVTDEQINKFKESLTALLEQNIPYAISVDYGPDTTLRTALDAAGIDAGMGTLPIKTVMWIDGESVKVRYGYGADVETLA